MTGPQVERLRAGVAGANRALIETAHTEWSNGATLLNAVAQSLSGAAPNIQGQIGTSGQAAAHAFTKVSEKVKQRADQMTAAGQALNAAFEALKQAEATRDYIDAHPVTDPGPRPTPSPGMDPQPDDITAMKAWTARSNAASAQASDHETKAQLAADHMDHVYQQSTATMKKVHGEPDPKPVVPPPPPSGGGGSTPGGGGSTPPTGGGGGKHPGTFTSGSHWVPAPDHNGHDTSGNNTGHDTGTGGNATTGDNTTVDPWLPPGSEEGGDPSGPGTIGAVPGGSVSTGTGGSGLGATGGVAGALGGGLMGGMTGITGAVRGASVTSTGGAAAAARPIGATTRTGATGAALGRGTSASTAGSPSGARGGARSAGGGTRGATKGGSRGAAGSRGSAGGGPGGRSKKDPKKQGTDFFEEEQDWIDDEDAAPGVID